MSVTDPIADMLTCIRNSLDAGHEASDIRHSRLKGEIARILKREGYVSDYVVEGGGNKKTLRIYLKYTDEGKPVVLGLRRVSKPGLRRHSASGKLPRVLGGFGTLILSTSSGVMTGAEAKAKGIGGEILCEVW